MIANATAVFVTLLLLRCCSAIPCQPQIDVTTSPELVTVEIRPNTTCSSHAFTLPWRESWTATLVFGNDQISIDGVKCTCGLRSSLTHPTPSSATLTIEICPNEVEVEEEKEVQLRIFDLASDICRVDYLDIMTVHRAATTTAATTITSTTAATVTTAATSTTDSITTTQGPVATGLSSAQAGATAGYTIIGILVAAGLFTMVVVFALVIRRQRKSQDQNLENGTGDDRVGTTSPEVEDDRVRTSSLEQTHLQEHRTPPPTPSHSAHTETHSPNSVTGLIVHT